MLTSDVVRPPLPHKAFENQLRVEIVSGRPPSEQLLIHWGRRTEEGSLPVICLTLVLTYTQASESWDVLKEAALEALGDIPSDAACVLAQAMKAARWPRTIFQEFTRDGEEHIIASLHLNDLTYEAKVSFPLRGNSKYARQVAAYELLKGIVEHRQTSQKKLGGAATRAFQSHPKPIGKNIEKSPISILYEHCQAKSIESPTFDYRLYGAKPQLRATCRALFQGYTFMESAKSKHEAKIVVCQKILQHLRLV